MQYGMFGPAHVQIDSAGFPSSHPVAFGSGISEPILDVGCDITEIVPTRTSPLRHRVQFSDRTIRESLPLFGFGQWWIGRSGRTIIYQRRRYHRKRTLVESFVMAVPPNDGERLAPVTLPGKSTAAPFAIYLTFTSAHCF